MLWAGVRRQDAKRQEAGGGGWSFRFQVRYLRISAKLCGVSLCGSVR